MTFLKNINAYKLKKNIKIMIIKAKKVYRNRMVKLLAHGEIREIIVNEDVFNPQKKRVLICYKSHRDSGIVELSHNEANDLIDTLKKELNVIKEFKIIKEMKKR
jgi:hypothetical protein